MPKSNSTELIEELLKTIDRVGLKKTIQGLRDTLNPLNETEVLQEYIISKTCSAFQISKQTLLTGRKNEANRTNAIGTACLMLRYFCHLSQRDIASVLRKDYSNVSKYIYKFETLDKNFKKDNDIIKIMDIIEKEIIEFDTKLKTNNNG